MRTRFARTEASLRGEVSAACSSFVMMIEEGADSRRRGQRRRLGPGEKADNDWYEGVDLAQQHIGSRPEGQSLEPVCIQHFRGESFVQGGKSVQQGLILPVVGIDHVEVVARFHDPPEA